MLNVMVRLLTKLKATRRWMQFSVRTGLLLVTLLCIALGIWVVPAERQRRAVMAIQRLGGLVVHRGDGASKKAFSRRVLARFLPRDYVDCVEIVFLDDPQISDESLVILHALATVEVLWLDDTEVADAGITHLQALPALRELHLAHTHISDVGLISLSRLKYLETLTLNSTNITDGGLAYLQRLESLRTLDLSGTLVTDRGLARLRQTLPCCRITNP